MARIFDFPGTTSPYDPRNYRFDLEGWLERGQVDERTLYWGGKPRGWRRFVPAAVRDLLSEIREQPGSHLVVAFLGLWTGCLATAGFAWVWSLFL